VIFCFASDRLRLHVVRAIALLDCHASDLRLERGPRRPARTEGGLQWHRTSTTSHTLTPEERIAESGLLGKPESVEQQLRAHIENVHKQLDAEGA
jgi:hypothetical protein